MTYVRLLALVININTVSELHDTCAVMALSCALGTVLTCC